MELQRFCGGVRVYREREWLGKEVLRGRCKTTSRSGEVPGPFDVEAQELRPRFASSFLIYTVKRKPRHSSRRRSYRKTGDAAAATGRRLSLETPGMCDRPSMDRHFARIFLCFCFFTCVGCIVCCLCLQS